MSRASSERAFGRVGQATARLFELTNALGHVARISDYGATLVELHIPDRHGELADVVLGFDEVSGYLSPSNQSFGCSMGRVTGRIAGAAFQIGELVYRLAPNNGPNHIHGGSTGRLGRQLWRLIDATQHELSFAHHSPHGEEGYPGNVDFELRYRLTDEGELHIEYGAQTDRSTPINLTNHSYWNLAGAGSGSVLGHELCLASSHVLRADMHLLPTGDIDPVAHTPFDFREFRALGQEIGALLNTPAKGYDHNFVLQPTQLPAASLAASLRDPSSGRVLELLTTERGVQLYTGNGLKGQHGKAGRTYEPHSACCLEAQNWPDAINHPHFPNVLLEPGQTYRQHTIHRFSTY